MQCRVDLALWRAEPLVQNRQHAGEQRGFRFKVYGPERVVSVAAVADESRDRPALFLAEPVCYPPNRGLRGGFLRVGRRVVLVRGRLAGVGVHEQPAAAGDVLGFAALGGAPQVRHPRVQPEVQVGIAVAVEHDGLLGHVL